MTLPPSVKSVNSCGINTCLQVPVNRFPWYAAIEKKFSGFAYWWWVNSDLTDSLFKFWLHSQTYDKVELKEIIDSGKKPLILRYRKQAQDMVDLLLWQCELSFDSPDGILLDKNKKLETNAIEGYSFWIVHK